MEPRISSGQEVTIDPNVEPKVGDVVLARVRGTVYLHKVTAIDQKTGRCLIANNRGRTNGWSSVIYGVATGV